MFHGLGIHFEMENIMLCTYTYTLYQNAAVFHLLFFTILLIAVGSFFTLSSCAFICFFYKKIFGFWSINCDNQICMFSTWMLFLLLIFYNLFFHKFSKTEKNIFDSCFSSDCCDKSKCILNACWIVRLQQQQQKHHKQIHWHYEMTNIARRTHAHGR